jgi:hypothetical protein
MCVPELVGECANVAGSFTIAWAHTLWTFAIPVDILGDVTAPSRSDLSATREYGESEATAASIGLLVVGPKLTVRQAGSRVGGASACEERCGTVLVILACLAAGRRVFVGTNAILVADNAGTGTIRGDTVADGAPVALARLAVGANQVCGCTLEGLDHCGGRSGGCGSHGASARNLLDS